MGARVGIALGTNLGNRLSNLKQARDMLRALVDPESHYLQAPIYQSEPVDCTDDSPDFYNTVIELDYTGKPYDLLAKTQGIEFHLGRESVYERNSPRVIDIDILYFGDEVMHEEILFIPHPRLTDRLFVLHPLMDIRSDLILPGDEATIAEHLKHIDTAEPELNLVQSLW